MNNNPVIIIVVLLNTIIQNYFLLEYLNTYIIRYKLRRMAYSLSNVCPILKFGKKQ